MIVQRRRRTAGEEIEGYIAVGVADRSQTSRLSRN
jgi:hypothetical protein